LQENLGNPLNLHACEARKFIARLSAVQPQQREHQGDTIMVKLAHTTIYSPSKSQKETQMDKTSRAVRVITQGETEKRQGKTARLRKVRLEKEEDTPV